MAKVLDLYMQKKDEYQKKLSAGTLPLQQLPEVSELNYRIDVLETCRAFCQNAPVTKETDRIVYHYQMVDAYVRFMQNERRFGPRTDETGQKRREMAAASLERVAEEYRRRFAGFNASKEDQYKQSIGKIINSVLSVWLQYRDTYVPIQIGS